MRIESKASSGLKEYFDAPLEVKAENVKEDGTFTGYGSIFEGPPDAYGDIVMPGAFQKSIKKGGRNGTGVAMLYQHDSDWPIGTYPELAEDAKGLRLVGDIVTETTMGGDAHKLLKAGALRGLSIGFNTVRFEMDNDAKTRKLIEVDLWEISLVTFPAHKGAKVIAVKAAILEAKTARELENALREAGLSKDIANYLVKLSTPSLREAGRVVVEAESEMSALLEELQRINQTSAN